MASHVKYCSLTWLSISLVVFMAVSLPFVQPSRTSLQAELGYQTVSPTQDERGGAGGASLHEKLGAVESSEREVPTGPDPLHHNNNPTSH